jgi:DNA-binding transcriptional MerR regulator
VEIGTKKEKGISLADLAEEVGIPARTIRFYIARGLIPGPQKAGRGATYTKVHGTQLRGIKKLQAKGLTLNEVARSLAGKTNKAVQAPPPSAWWQYPVADEVVVSVKANVSPWRLREVQRAVREMAVTLNKGR